jgi:ASC-1-like (ASCH) protein
LGGEITGNSNLNSPQEMADDLRKYYSKEEEKKYGVVGIHIALI